MLRVTIITIMSLIISLANISLLVISDRMSRDDDTGIWSVVAYVSMVLNAFKDVMLLIYLLNIIL